MTSIRYAVCHIGFKGNVILALEGILLSTGLVQMGSCCTLVLFKMGDCLGKGISGLTVCPPPCTIMSHMPHSLRPITYLYLYYVFVFVRCQICHTVWGHQVIWLQHLHLCDSLQRLVVASVLYPFDIQFAAFFSMAFINNFATALAHCYAIFLCSWNVEIWQGVVTQNRRI